MTEFLTELDLYIRIACAALIVVALALIMVRTGDRLAFATLALACLLGTAYLLGVVR